MTGKADGLQSTIVCFLCNGKSSTAKFLNHLEFNHEVFFYQTLLLRINKVGVEKVEKILNYFDENMIVCDKKIKQEEIESKQNLLICDKETEEKPLVYTEKLLICNNKTEKEEILSDENLSICDQKTEVEPMSSDENIYVHDSKSEEEAIIPTELSTKDVKAEAKLPKDLEHITKNEHDIEGNLVSDTECITSIKPFIGTIETKVDIKIDILENIAKLEDINKFSDHKNDVNQIWNTKLLEEIDTSIIRSEQILEGKKFKSKNYEKYHSKKVHRKTKLYNCKFCEFKGKKKKILQEHVKSIHENLVHYNCGFCEFKTKKRNELKYHITNYHGKTRMFNCEECSYETDSKLCIKKHMLEGHSHPCKLCDYNTYNKKNLRGHLRSVHMKNKVYNCDQDQCAFKSTYKSSVKKHKLSTHDNVRSFACDICNYKAVFKKNLKIHKECVHEKKIEYNCDYCNYATAHKSGLKSHIDNKHLGLRFSCKLCDSIYRSQTALKKHNDKIHLGKHVSYVCEHCGRNFSTAFILNEHTRFEHEGFLYQCDKCDFTGRRKIHLAKHTSKIHDLLDVKKYKCDECRQSFTWNRSLKVHIEAVHKGIQYNCDQCNHTVKRKYELNKHIKIVHSGEEVTLHSCSSCKYKAKRKYDLKKHKLNVHMKH